MNTHLKELEKYTPQCTEIFKKISRFYNSSWPEDIPFIVTLYPIPGASGTSSATPHANSLCVGMLTEETDYAGRAGIVLHEMSHVLYDEQSAAFQHTLDGYFSNNTSPYKRYAYAFFDEALATALGNGWGYKQLSGELDPLDWYNNTYINGFGKAIYPLVEEYLSQNKQLDQEFVNRAIDIFGETFPTSLTDYSVLLNNLSFYINSEDYTEIQKHINLLMSNFHVTGVNSSAPISDPTSIDYLKTKEGTHLIILDQKQQETMKVLKNIFPELKKVKLKTGSVVSFTDNQGRTVILLYAAEKEDVLQLYKAIKEQKNFDRSKLIQYEMNN